MTCRLTMSLTERFVREYTEGLNCSVRQRYLREFHGTPSLVGAKRCVVFAIRKKLLQILDTSFGKRHD